MNNYMRTLKFLICASACCTATAMAELVVENGGLNRVDSHPAIAVPAPAGPQTPAASAAPQRDTLGKALLLNQDQLSGRLISISKEGIIEWSSPSAEGPVLFSRSALQELRLKPAETIEKASHRVTLKNGDAIPGTLVSLDGERAVIQTSYAGKLEIPRTALLTAAPFAGSGDVVFEGPGNAEDWSNARNQRAWKFDEEGMTAYNPGYIGRDLKLPDVAHIEFDLSWRGQLQLMFTMYTDEIENPSGNCYSVQLNNNYVYLHRMTRNGSSRSLGQSEIPILSQKTKARIGLKVSKPAKTIVLLIDGKPVQQWSDSAEFAGKGTGMVFYSQIRGFTRISDFRVTPWDGQSSVDSENATAPDTDLISLKNKDKLSGKVNTITEGTVKLESAFAPLEIPLERVTEIRFAKVTREEDTPKPEDVRVTLPAGGQLTFRVQNWSTESVTAQHPFAGTIQIRPGVFEKVEFNLDKPRTDGEEFLIDEEGMDH
jgi:hypothetical protein